jgi:hypothetical protein
MIYVSRVLPNWEHWNPEPTDVNDFARACYEQLNDLYWEEETHYV